MKRILSIVAVIALLVTFMVPAFAAAPTITVNQAKNGETYKAYKIFDATINGDAYSYTFSPTGAFTNKIGSTNATGAAGLNVMVAALVNNNLITLTPTAADPNKYIVAKGSALDSNNDDDLVRFLKNQYDNGMFTMTAAATQVAANGTVTLNVTNPGYYFVTTSQGSAVIADTANNPTINDKTLTPTVEKTVNDSDLALGDTVTYTATITLKKGLVNAVFHDQFPAGVTFGGTSNVTVTGVTSGNYTVAAATDGDTFDITFTQAYLNTLTADTTITVTYTGTLNSSANLGTANTTNQNKAWVTWGNQLETEKAVVNVNTGSIILTKTGKDSAKLQGVKFNLYKGSSTTPLKFTQSNEKYYLASTGGSADLVTDANGKITIELLESGTYSFKETATLAGYELLTAAVPVNDFDQAGETVSVTVENQTGSELPSTGGIGTIIFVTLGGIAVLVAGVFLLSNKRMSKEDF